MDGVYYLLSIIATGLVMWWVITNDRVGPEEKTHGLFAMRDEGDSADREKDRTGRRARPVQPPSARSAPGRPARR